MRGGDGDGVTPVEDEDMDWRKGGRRWGREIEDEQGTRMWKWGLIRMMADGDILILKRSQAFLFFDQHTQNECKGSI